MIEAGVVMRDLTLENPIRAIREISHDMTGRRKVRLANGREVSALDIQSEYLTVPRTSSRGAVATEDNAGAADTPKASKTASSETLVFKNARIGHRKRDAAPEEDTDDSQ